MTRDNILSQLFHYIENVLEQSRRLWGIIMVFQLAVDQDGNQSTIKGFEIIVEKGCDLMKQCETLFEYYKENSKQLREAESQSDETAFDNL